MPLTVTQRPSITFDSKTARFNAVANPIVYKMVRKDFLSTSVVNSGGNLRITIDTGSSTTFDSFIVGQSAYFQSDNGVYDGNYVLLSKSYSAPTHTLTFTGGFTSAATTGYMNLTNRLNYRVSVDLYNNLDQLLFAGFDYYPDSKGNLLIDVSRACENFLNEDNLTAYTTFGQFLDSNFLHFYIRYTERWLGSSNSVQNDTANRFFAVGGGLQIGSSTGGNLGAFTIFDTLTVSARFLNVFTRPKMYRGYPFSICALIQNPGVNTQFRIEWFNVSGGSISTNTTTATSLDNSMRRLVIDPATIPVTAVRGTIRLQTTAPVVLSETLNFDVVEPCDNPILLVWRNSLGGDSLWCFDFNQELTYAVKETKNKRLKLFADQISLNEWEALNELNTVGDVYATPVLELNVNKNQAKIGQQVYQLLPNGTKIGVVPIITENRTFTRQKTHNFEMNVEYPAIYVP